MKRWVMLIALVLVVLSAESQEAGISYTKANQAYRNGEYANAATLYEQIVANGYESPSLYYNLGNAKFKLNDVPGAILNFEKARRLAPRDEDIAYNLRLANLRVIDKVDPIPEFFLTEWWHAFIRLFSSATWALFACAMLWGAVACAGIIMFLKSVALRRLFFFSAVVLIFGAILATSGIVLQTQYERSEAAAIIFSPSLSVKSSPDAKSTDLFVLHEGVKVEVLDNVENWRKIRLADGKIGWIPAESIQII